MNHGWQVLAVESKEHLPMPVSKESSLPYVRKLHNHLPIDSEEYILPQNAHTLQKALESAALEVNSVLPLTKSPAVALHESVDHG